jgi:hypothetical protein
MPFEPATPAKGDLRSSGEIASSGGVCFPLGRLTHAEPCFHALSLECFIGRQGPTHSLVHHGEAIVSERLIIRSGRRMSI